MKWAGKMIDSEVCNEKHVRKARKEYICDKCNKIIRKGELYFADFTTRPMGRRGLINVTTNHYHLSCAPERCNAGKKWKFFHDNFSSIC